MRHDEEDVEPNQPEMPDARSVVSSKECCQPMELHGLVDRPTGSDGKEARYRNSEVCCPLERVVLCLENRMRPLPARQFGEWKTDVVPKHRQSVKKIGPARQQGTPASAHYEPCNVHQAIQHE